MTSRQHKLDVAKSPNFPSELDIMKLYDKLRLI